jgi:uncharacterized membrane protein
MSWPKRLLLWLMAVFYVYGGVMHLVRPEYYRPMMPPYLPAHDFLIWLSGVAELVLGILVVDARVRVYAAWGLIALLIAIFPANLHIAFNNVPLFGNAEGYGIFNWVRLPFQLVFIAWAWWYTRPDGESAPAQPAQPLAKSLAPAGDELWLSKPPILQRMDRLARDPEIMRAALAAIESQPLTSLLQLGVEHGYVADERDHLERDWFDAENGWLKDLPAIEPVLRSAFVRAAHLALERGLPVESFWIRGGDRFEVGIAVTERAVIQLFISPNTPRAGKLVARDFEAIWIFGGQGVERVGQFFGGR